jgi:hypothetical protein
VPSSRFANRTLVFRLQFAPQIAPDLAVSGLSIRLIIQVIFGTFVAYVLVLLERGMNGLAWIKTNIGF